MLIKQRVLYQSCLILIISAGLAACFSLSELPPPKGSAPAHPAAYSQDHFTYNKEQSHRKPNDFKFYYKHCTVDERHPFPTGAIWQCTSP